MMTGIDQEIGQLKVCKKCGEGKIRADFNADRSRKDGLQDRCRTCRNNDKRTSNAENPEQKRLSDKKYREANKEAIAIYQKGYRADNANKLSESKKDYRELNKDKIRIDRAKRREERTETQKEKENTRRKKWLIENKTISEQKNAEWRKSNPEAVRDIKRRYKKKRLSTAKGRLESNISRGVHRGLREGTKEGRGTFNLLGYSLGDLQGHLEHHFLPGMTWDNYGEWHVDHLIPLTAFNYETPDHLDFRRCWALSNLRPLWGRDNMSKGARLMAPFQPSLQLVAP